ncbi:YuzD family protein [Bacillus kwashiorkori]|uniref:YuzD family protein n=1 Tax=Bacillus kwashiorkori TaxID=1522318 RepID=UPI000782B884|nr:YuzD family protein [Bacillus kwashiorkori]
MEKQVTITVYGAERICASCVNLPSSKETYEWLQAAITRKYPNQPFTLTYVDIDHPPKNMEHRNFAQKIIEEDIFYPVVLVEDKIIAEGNPRLKKIYEEMEKFGYQAAN